MMCRFRKNRSTAAGTPRNTMKVQWQMVSFTTFYDSITICWGGQTIHLPTGT